MFNDNIKYDAFAGALEMGVSQLGRSQKSLGNSAQKFIKRLVTSGEVTSLRQVVRAESIGNKFNEVRGASAPLPLSNYFLSRGGVGDSPHAQFMRKPSIEFNYRDGAAGSPHACQSARSHKFNLINSQASDILIENEIGSQRIFFD